MFDSPSSELPSIELYRQGRFLYHKLVRFFDFENINDAIPYWDAGSCVKLVIRM